MNIQNIRLGFANNSSSSHSILFLEKQANFSDSVEGQEFGWGFFTLASQQAKMSYFAQILSVNLAKNKIPFKYCNEIVKSLCGVEIDSEGYIDHQSQITLPVKNNGEIDVEFIDDFQQYLSNERVLVLGGNDNDEYSHPYSDQGRKISIPLPYDNLAKKVISRKDKVNNYWTFFDADTGNKVRFSFDDNPIPEKSTFPELVDLKITDFCPFGCSFCYQNSTEKGVPANYDYIDDVIHSLASMGVFEIAFGGGEPTLYYQNNYNFKNILETCNYYNIAANFTTRNLQALLDQDLLNLTSSFAFSCESYSVFNKFAKMCQENKTLIKKGGVQLIIGEISEYDYNYIIDACNEMRLRVTLLGYKQTGRGTKPKYNFDWMKNILDKPYLRVAIDTALAKQSIDKLNANRYHRISYHTQEGGYSCYIDAVNRKIGPSSYCDANKMLDLPSYQELTSRWLEIIPE